MTDVALSPVLGIARGDSGSSSGDVTPFSLVGNVMHTGYTLDSGHYYADVRCDGRWFRVDDLKVAPIEWDPLRDHKPTWSYMAYVQMYSCCSTAALEP